MSQQSDVSHKAMPRINIDCLKSISRYLQKSQTSFELKEDEYCSITKGNVSLKIFPNQNYAVVTLKNNKEHKFKIDSIPKQYHYLYWFLLKMIKKLRKKTIKYTIIRKKELDKTDKITCFISLSGAYTFHFKMGKIAYLKSRNSDIKFIQNKKTRTIPFTYRENSKSAIHYNDAFDKLRSIVHELMQCADIVEKQKLKQLNYSKTWKVQWNADTGSIEDIREEKKICKKTQSKEGLFKWSYQSDTTVSSDYSDTNSEIAYDEFRSKSLSTVNETKQSLSTVQTSYSSINSIKSEASWRAAKNNAKNSSMAKQQLLQLDSWTKQDVCCWLKHNHYSKDMCMIFWNHNIDGNALIKISSNDIYKMFAKIKSVTKQDMKKIIFSINQITSN